MTIPESIVLTLKNTAKKLTGIKKRQFMAEAVNNLGQGAQRAAERQLNWCRNTILKGQRELKSGIDFIDNFSGRGRKKAEEHNPNLIADIEKIVEGKFQADPSLKSERAYLKITAPEVRRQLKERFDYNETELPSVTTIRKKLNSNGYHLKKVRKTLPKKKLPETDDIFKNLTKVNNAADTSPNILRISLDAKDKVKMGNLSRGGKNRKETYADDHDFGIVGLLTPVGLYLPKEKDLFFYMVRSKVTSDCIVDIIENWWQSNKDKYKYISKLLINLDNGPDQNSQRTQFIKRIQEFADQEGLEIHLAYYPPYHSKYNPVERTFGTLEQYWSGEILNNEEAVMGYAKSMTFAEKHPTVSLITKTYQKGVKVSKKMMNKIHAGLERTKGIEKYSVLFKPRLYSG